MPQLVAVGEGETPYIAMEMVGKSLESVRRERPFSALTIAQLGAQLIESFESLHSANYIHRDVKCDNLALALDSSDPRIFVIDLGAATRYKVNGMHIRYDENSGFTGNLTFCSLNVLQGIRASRRDDLESIAYILVYLFRNTLPWSHINTEDTRKRDEQMDIKLDTTSSQLCRGLEPEYKHFLDYCRGLKYEEQPDYKYAKELFMRLASRLGFRGNWQYDWTPRPKAALQPPAKERRASLQLLLNGKDIVAPSPGQLLTDLHGSTSSGTAGSASPIPDSLQAAARSRPRIVVMQPPPSEEPLTPQVAFEHSIAGVRRMSSTPS